MSTPTKNEAVVYDGTGKPINLAKPDGLAIPHVFTFAGLLQGAWNTYYHDGSHEGFRHNRENALHMRNDLRLEAAFQERKRAVKILPWRIEVEDESDPKQAVVKDLTTKILNRIPRFRRMLGYLLEAVWWGRYGSQLLFAWEEICDAGGVPYQVMQPVKHDPIFGDKLGFRHDGTPYVRVYGAAPNIGNIKPIYSTQGPAIPLVGTLRERFLIHTYNPLDADYFDIEGADAKFGVGLSSLGYWQQWVKNEFASWVTEFFEKVGLGLVMVEFESGNTQSEAAADDAIKNLGKRSVIKVPRAAGGTSTWGNTESIRILEVPASGATMIREWIEYFDESFERLIIGQSMSSGSDAEGSLGGSGRANLAKDTKSQIIEDDALDLEETITGSKYEPGLIHTIVKYSFPWVDFPVQFKLGIKPDNSKERMEAIQAAVGMGVAVKEADVREACNVDAPEHGDAIVGGQAGQTPGKFGEGGPFEPPFDQDPQDEDQGGDEGDFEPTEINRWKQSKGKRGGKLWVNESTGEKSYRDHSQHFGDDRHMEQYAADKKTGGHWVTMGGDSEEGGGKHHGGHPVLLDGEGRIIGGNVPRSWQGRHISEAFKPPAKEETAKAAPAEDGTPAPSEQASKAKPKKAATKQAKSLHSVIKDRGGIDPSKIGGDYNISEEFIQSGLFGVLRKGGTSLDEMASNLHDEGYIKIPEGRNGDDYLLEALHGKYKTMHHQYDAEIEAQQKAYYEELENAKQYANQSEIDEAVRSGQEAGKAEGRESEIGEGLSELADEEGTYSAEDLDFNPSELDAPTEAPKGSAKDRLAKHIADSPGLSDDHRKLYQAAVEGVLSAMPQKAHDALGESLKNARFHPNGNAMAIAVTDAAMAAADEEGKKALAERKKYIQDNGLVVAGSFLLNTSEVHLDGDIEVPGGGDASYGKYGEKTVTMNGTYSHEFMHAIDGADFKLSKSPEWMAAYNSEIMVGADENAALTSYAQEAPYEGLAEFGRLLFGTDVPLEQIEKDFPKASAFFKDQGYWPTREGGSQEGISEQFDSKAKLDFGKEGHADVLLKDKGATDRNPDAAKAEPAKAKETAPKGEGMSKASKEPHEMTREAFDEESEMNGNPLSTKAHKDAREYRGIIEKKVKDKYGRGGVNEGVIEAEAKQYETPDGRTYWDIIKAGESAGPEDHRSAVASALAAGKPVPPEVLADYPDLAPQAPAPAQAEAKPAKPAKAPKAATSTEDTNASLSDLVADSLKADGKHSFAELDSKVEEMLGRHSVAELKDIAKAQNLAVLKPTKAGIIGQFKARLRDGRAMAQRVEFRPLNAENKSPNSATNVVDKPKGNATIVDKPASETGEPKKEGGKMSEPNESANATPAAKPDLMPPPSQAGFKKIKRYTETTIDQSDVESRQKLKDKGFKYNPASRSWYAIGHHNDVPGELTHHVVTSPDKHAGFGDAALAELRASKEEAKKYKQAHLDGLRDSHDVRPTDVLSGKYALTPLADSVYSVKAKSKDS